jgi:hypothetical protein
MWRPHAAAEWRRDDDPGGSPNGLDGDVEERYQAPPPPAKEGPWDALWRWRSQNLSEVVLSWSVEQILDKEMLRDKVRVPAVCLPASSLTPLYWPLGAGHLARVADDLCESGDPCEVLSVNGPHPF